MPELTDEQFERLTDEMRKVREEDDARQADKGSADFAWIGGKFAVFSSKPRNQPRQKRRRASCFVALVQ